MLGPSGTCSCNAVFTSSSLGCTNACLLLFQPLEPHLALANPVLGLASNDVVDNMDEGYHANQCHSGTLVWEPPFTVNRPIVDQLYDDVPTLGSTSACLNSLRVVSPGVQRRKSTREGPLDPDRKPCPYKTPSNCRPIMSRAEAPAGFGF